MTVNLISYISLYLRISVEECDSGRRGMHISHKWINELHILFWERVRMFAVERGILHHISRE
jgi:hypothetical protein